MEEEEWAVSVWGLQGNVYVQSVDIKHHTRGESPAMTRHALNVGPK